ncbi:hypothetical protein, partial [Pseudomonas savastanoi]|uniref:hypothetical protein n=1 Tax=Pseudomonas savastanoi TaxID=29438 RepID=UPI001C7EA1B4
MIVIQYIPASAQRLTHMNALKAVWISHFVAIFSSPSHRLWQQVPDATRITAIFSANRDKVCRLLAPP